MVSKMSESSVKNAVLKYALDFFGAEPEYLWENDYDNAVLRHSDTKKWFAAVMAVRKDRLGLIGENKIDVINVKCDPLIKGSLLGKKGFLPAYHMNKEHWITILLDGSADAEEICVLLSESFRLTDKKRKVLRNKS